MTLLLHVLLSFAEVRILLLEEAHVVEFGRQSAKFGFVCLFVTAELLQDGVLYGFLVRGHLHYLLLVLDLFELKLPQPAHELSAQLLHALEDVHLPVFHWLELVLLHSQLLRHSTHYLDVLRVVECGAHVLKGVQVSFLEYFDNFARVSHNFDFVTDRRQGLGDSVGRARELFLEHIALLSVSSVTQGLLTGIIGGLNLTSDISSLFVSF